MDKLRILERINALMLLASKDETRYHLNGVCIKKGDAPDGVILQVTDGYRLSREIVYCLDLYSVLNASDNYVVYRVEHKKLKAMIKAEAVVNFERENDTIIIHGDNGNQLRAIASKYPLLEKVIPNKSDAWRSVSFNARYLAEIEKALGVNSKREGVKVFFNPTEASSPLYIESQGKMAVLMPMRL